MVDALARFDIVRPGRKVAKAEVFNWDAEARRIQRWAAEHFKPGTGPRNVVVGTYKGRPLHGPGLAQVWDSLDVR